MKNPEDNDISEEDKDLFRKTVEGIRPLNKTHPSLKKTSSTAQQYRKHAATTFRSQETSPFIKTPVTSEERLEFIAETGLQKKQFDQLKKGLWPIDATLDLHGMTVIQAEQRLKNFIARSRKQADRCILVIHGKGGDSPVLKNWLNETLREHTGIIAFCSTQPKHGGTGAVYVLLKKSF